jgi:hypothetical protein
MNSFKSPTKYAVRFNEKIPKSFEALGDFKKITTVFI